MSGHDGFQKFFGCGACRRSFTITVTRDSDDNNITDGPKFCFDGAHSSAPLAADDERRVVPNTVHLTAGPNLQRDIDALPEDVVTLMINADAGGMSWDSDRETRLRKALPRLESLQLVDTKFTEVRLTHALTPNLKKLRMQNLGDGCELVVELPKLRDVTIHYFRSGAGGYTIGGWGLYDRSQFHPFATRD